MCGDWSHSPSVAHILLLDSTKSHPKEVDLKKVVAVACMCVYVCVCAYACKNIEWCD